MFFNRKASAAPKIAVLGGFRTGTNFLRAVLELNFDCQIIFHANGWKHGFVPVLSGHSVFKIKPVPGVFMTKSPLSFLLSLHRYHQEVGRNITAGSDWESFLRSPLTIYEHPRGETPEYRFSTPVEYWNALNWNLHSLTRLDRSIYHCRYEDLLEASETVVCSLANQLGLVRKSEIFVVPQRRVKRTSGQPVANAKYETPIDFDKSFYTQARYLKTYSPEDIDFVNTRLDSELMGALGYLLDKIEVK